MNDPHLRELQRQTHMMALKEAKRGTSLLGVLAAALAGYFGAPALWCAGIAIAVALAAYAINYVTMTRG